MELGHLLHDHYLITTHPLSYLIHLLKIYANKILRKKKNFYEGFRKFQDAWIIRLPWVDFVVGDMRKFIKLDT